VCSEIREERRKKDGKCAMQYADGSLLASHIALKRKKYGNGAS